MDEKILNPLTGRYVKKTGKIGKIFIHDVIPMIGKYVIEKKNIKKIKIKLIGQF
jgi:hypothetical protein